MLMCANALMLVQLNFTCFRVDSTDKENSFNYRLYPFIGLKMFNAPHVPFQTDLGIAKILKSGITDDKQSSCLLNV